ncbi:MAG: HAMP domain-containing protein, partial [Anaerolineae bacterium]
MEPMLRDYLTLTAAIVFGSAVIMATIYLIYRRGIALRLTAILLACIVFAAYLAFILGREGINLVTISVALAIGLPPILGAFILMSRQIIAPTRLIAETAAHVARGDVEQRVDIEARDEFGEMVVAFQGMVAYLQEMATAADRLAQGDVTAKVSPQSDQDVLS